MELRRNPDVIICTPGRLIDLVKNSQAIDLDYIEVVIFDEVFILLLKADKLLELGFEAEIEEIIKSVNPQR
jgi:ATP-dependent RNA helicase DDX27